MNLFGEFRKYIRPQYRSKRIPFHRGKPVEATVMWFRGVKRLTTVCTAAVRIWVIRSNTSKIIPPDGSNIFEAHMYVKKVCR